MFRPWILTKILTKRSIAMPCSSRDNSLRNSINLCMILSINFKTAPSTCKMSQTAILIKYRFWTLSRAQSTKRTSKQFYRRSLAVYRTKKTVSVCQERKIKTNRKGSVLFKYSYAAFSKTSNAASVKKLVKVKPMTPKDPVYGASLMPNSSKTTTIIKPLTKTSWLRSFSS